MQNENFMAFLPYYLSKERKEGLLEELKSYQNIRNYFMSSYNNDVGEHELVQGDIVLDVPIYIWDKEEENKTHGIIISNSCDISEENNRYKEIFVTFCPLISMAGIEEMLLNANKDLKIIDDIKKQEVNSYFYIPKEGVLKNDAVAVLNESFSIPITKVTKTNKRATLSQIGFYLLLFKLSINFCRMHEGINRCPF